MESLELIHIGMTVAVLIMEAGGLIIRTRRKATSGCTCGNSHGA